MGVWWEDLRNDILSTWENMLKGLSMHKFWNSRLSQANSTGGRREDLRNDILSTRKNMLKGLYA